jgi:REP element-mobilizing transposase RayT
MRLKGYHYSQSGLYFITICVQNHDCLFGTIIDGKTALNKAGEMIEKWVVELENKFPEIKCHERVIMPNHIHCIIEIETDRNDDYHLGEKMIPGLDGLMIPGLDAHVGAPLRGRPTKYGHNNIKYGVKLGTIIDWFKTMTTNEYIRGVKNFGWKRFDQKLWQRNYWDHIIRNERSINRIAEYIEHNPSKWDEDQFKNDCGL